MSTSEFFTKTNYSFSDKFTAIRKIYSSDSGYTEIYSARKALKRFALKSLKPEFRDDPFYVGMLRKEFEIGFRLDHPGIMNTYSFEEIEGIGPCIILEWIEGETLEKNIEANTLKDKEWRNVIMEICDILGYLESHQIVHKDIKPSNIMLTADGKHVKLIDFGFSDSPEYWSLKHSGGTRSYAAPEQVEAAGHPITHLSDIFSFGKLLKSVPMTKSKKLTKLIESMQGENPSARPQDIGEVKKKLEKAIDHQYQRVVVGLAGLFLILSIIIALVLWIVSARNKSIVAPEIETPQPVIYTALKTGVEEISENSTIVIPESPAPTRAESNTEAQRVELNFPDDSINKGIIGDYSGGGYIYSEDYSIVMEMKIGADGKVSARYKNPGDYVWTQMRGRIDKYTIKIEHVPDPEVDYEMTMKFDYVFEDNRLELSGYAQGADEEREKMYVVLGKML